MPVGKAGSQPQCTVNGCNNKSRSSGLCQEHYATWDLWRRRQDWYKPKKRIQQKCSIYGCGGKHHAKGLCRVHYNAKEVLENPGRNRKYHVLNTYNITIERYNNISKNQNSKCAICGSNQSELRNKLSVDHDHKCCQGEKSCGKCIRGLICGNCNRGIGLFGDSVELLQAAINYLKQYRIIGDLKL